MKRLMAETLVDQIFKCLAGTCICKSHTSEEDIVLKALKESEREAYRRGLLRGAEITEDFFECGNPHSVVEKTFPELAERLRKEAEEK